MSSATRQTLANASIQTMKDTLHAATPKLVVTSPSNSTHTVLTSDETVDLISLEPMLSSSDNSPIAPATPTSLPPDPADYDPAYPCMNYGSLPRKPKHLSRPAKTEHPFKRSYSTPNGINFHSSDEEADEEEEDFSRSSLPQVSQI